jgi:hypothetical protein
LAICSVSPDELQGHLSRSRVSLWQRNPARGRRKLRFATDLRGKCDQKHSLSHLGHAVENSIQESVLAGITELLKDLTDLLCNVMPAIVQYVRNVLDHYRQRTIRLNICEIPEIEVAPGIVQEGIGVACHLPQLRPPHSCKGLAWGPSDNHVNCSFGFAKLELGDEVGRFLKYYVPGAPVQSNLAASDALLKKFRACDLAARGSLSTEATILKPARWNPRESPPQPANRSTTLGAPPLRSLANFSLSGSFVITNAIGQLFAGHDSTCHVPSGHRGWPERYACVTPAWAAEFVSY